MAVSQIITIGLTIFYVSWLIAVLVMLWKIWRSGTERGQRIDQSLIDSARTSASAAHTAAEAAKVLAQALIGKIGLLP